MAAKTENKFMLFVYISPEIVNSYRDVNCTGVVNHPVYYMNFNVCLHGLTEQEPHLLVFF